MKEYRVVIPEELYQIVNFVTDDVPGVGVINKSLARFGPKEVFDWHCSIMLHFNNLIENGMPDNNDKTFAEEFEDSLDEEIKGEDEVKPNALFLARLTRNKTRELIWRIHKPERVNKLLQNIIDKEDYIIPFDFRIDHDLKWDLAKWHLENCGV